MSLYGRGATRESLRGYVPAPGACSSQRGQPSVIAPEVIIRAHFHVALSPHIPLPSGGLFSSRGF